MRVDEMKTISQKLAEQLSPKENEILLSLISALKLDAELKYGLCEHSKELLDECGFHSAPKITKPEPMTGWRLQGPAGQKSPVFANETRCWQYMFGHVPTQEQIDGLKSDGFTVIPHDAR